MTIRIRRQQEGDAGHVCALSELCCGRKESAATSGATYRLFIAVHPDHRNQGIGSTLYSQIERELFERQAGRTRVRTRTIQTETIRFFAAKGFVDTYNKLGYDVPQTDAYRPLTPEQFERFLADPDLPHEGFSVATAGSQIVGFSYLLGKKGDAMNERLGFHRVSEEVRMQKTLGDEAQNRLETVTE